MARQGGQLNGWLWILPSLALPVVISASAWANHLWSAGDVVAPNVTFAGFDVSGMAPEEVAAHVGWREAEFLQTPVTIGLGERSVTMTAQEIGYQYHRGATLDAVVSARHNNGITGEFVSWATTPFVGVTVADEYRLDEDVARARLSEDEFVLVDPVDPELQYENGSMTVLPGVDGLGVDMDELITQLAVADIATGPLEVLAPTASVAPSLSDARAEAVARAVNTMTDEGLLVSLEGEVRVLDNRRLRSNVAAHSEEGDMTLTVDIEGLQRDLEGLFPQKRGELVKPELEVIDGEVAVISQGVPYSICCSTESVEEVASDFLDGRGLVHLLDTRPDDDETVAAWADGSQVVELVAEFTTRHPCCENRVTNIQTMADAVRGYYMVPGETLSLNEYIGPRTPEKGYLPAGAIRGGYMTDEVGGGVSQFATTMFNAAFFAGLELDEYQSHTVHFSRYPFGREATLSMPAPDLVLTNTTDYPVLIWPTYTPDSITVSVYSTKHIEVEELAQRVSNRNQCRHSEIDRQRTYPDGRVVVDTIVANYRPGDGLDCNGNPLPRLNQ
jgi:vancomycin resistance protein YoaR